jgi:hypothetical protein
VRQVMTDLYHEVIESLMAQKGVELLLPSDEAPLDERIDSLVDWSQAFLAGFGVVQQELSKASEELQEMIQDIASITQVSAEFDQEDEENEASFLVLYEHVRLGVMMAFEELASARMPEHAADPALICPPTLSMKERIMALFLFTRGERRRRLAGQPMVPKRFFARGFASRPPLCGSIGPRFSPMPSSHVSI